MKSPAETSSQAAHGRSPRLGLLQRRILAALTEHGDTDRYEVAGITELFDTDASPVRARWRW